ncbi:hypothetical protein RN001_014498 [Aquatica leii]|uniref:THAP-type domain-containing protein n=1 Tax=Aquatica leii TaxID=1421715 RepID=A0AAN7NY46_9COLE|nr:hypothetical protein RN001_014498 [Aquatica leii]
MVILCYLCKRKRGDGGLHRIPKNSSRPAWLAFCKLDETRDDVSKVHICSAHFAPSAFIEPRAKVLGNKMVLRPGSIPSILKPPPPSSSTTPSKVTDMQIIIKEEKAELLSENSFEELNDESSSTASCSTSDNDETTKTRRFLEPRYVGDIHNAHLASPRLAKMSLDLAKRTVLKQRKKIKTLQQNNRRLLERIKNLESFILGESENGVTDDELKC